MDALLLPLIAAALAEAGDKTMLLAILLGRRFARPGAVIGGVALAAAANAAIAAAGGAVVAHLAPHRATVLMLALALLGAGLGGLVRAKRPDDVPGWRLGPFATAALAFFIHGFGDKTQFIAFAFAAQGGAPVFAGFGAAIGVIAAIVPAVLAGVAPEDGRLRAIRLGACAALALAGLWVGLGVLLFT